MFFRLLILGTCFLQIVYLAASAKILGMFAYTGKSHFLVFQPVLKELARRGHQVTVFSYFEHGTTSENYTGILIPSFINTTSFLSMGEFDTKSNVNFYFMKQLNQLHYLTSVYENTMQLKEIKTLASEKYDVIITEMFNSHVMFGLFHKIGAPVIGFSSCNLLPWTNDALGNPNNPSYNPVIVSDLSMYMTLKERLLNMFYLIFSKIIYSYLFVPETQVLAEKYFGKLPDLTNVAENTNLILVNTHFSLFGAKPQVPGVIEVGGIHILPKKPLPKELNELFSKHNEVIFFSMGSVLNSGTMSPSKYQIFLNVFLELKQLILWKSSLKIREKTNNIILSDWYPQRDILAHPKTVLFISHCGLLGILEAIHSGVPILCIPMFGDQQNNAKAIVTAEIGHTLQYGDITEESLKKTLNTLLNDPKYKKNALRISKAFNDRPLSALDTAIYWIEYVIRHNGAPHMRSVIKHLTWYQYYNLDVIFIFLSIFYIIYSIVMFFVKSILKVVLCTLNLSRKKVKTS
ncbi:UDP-glycosyltransferase UGT5-like [Rhodnius prolixus]|uniref:UDP-glycosyltransferase UGT5-like n=1 Tax=Rhodnius prolixus TaxID=13249 RepID=UPI003D18F46C